MMMLAALACTFDHSGLVPGSPPSADDTSGSAGTGGQGGAGGSSENAGGDGPDAFSDDDANDPDGGAGGGPELDAPAPVSDATPDGANPRADDGSPDEASSDDGGDESAVADAGRDCSAKPNGKAFTSPGESTAHCYWFHSLPSHWVGAANTCTSEGGYLVTIASNEETAFVLGLLSTFPSDEKLWIGGTDGRFSSDGPGSGPYIWITGQPMSYVNWYSDTSTTEPNGACQTCGGRPCYCEHRVAIGSDGRWADDYEANPYRFVCESD
jgi:hypothetical protein